MSTMRVPALAAMLFFPAAGLVWWSGHDAAVVAALHAAGHWCLTMATAAVVAGSGRAPAMVAGLAGLAAVPALALLVLCGRGVVTLSRALGRGAVAGRAPPGAAVASPVAEAWIELPGRGEVTFGGEMLRLGSDPDNDVVLAGEGVESFHAVVTRSAEAEFVIVDTGGTGIEIGGRRLASARLADGDRIGFGGATLTFRRG